MRFLRPVLGLAIVVFISTPVFASSGLVRLGSRISPHRAPHAISKISMALSNARSGLSGSSSHAEIAQAMLVADPGLLTDPTVQLFLGAVHAGEINLEAAAVRVVPDLKGLLGNDVFMAHLSPLSSRSDAAAQRLSGTCMTVCPIESLDRLFTWTPADNPLSKVIRGTVTPQGSAVDIVGEETSTIHSGAHVALLSRFSGARVVIRGGRGTGAAFVPWGQSIFVEGHITKLDSAEGGATHSLRYGPDGTILVTAGEGIQNVSGWFAIAEIDRGLVVAEPVVP